MKDKPSGVSGMGEGPEAAAMKSHLMNIYEPSHLSERDSSVRLAMKRGGEGGETEGRQKGGGGGGVGADEGVAVAAG